MDRTVAQVAERLPNKQEALYLNPSNKKKILLEALQQKLECSRMYTQLIPAASLRGYKEAGNGSNTHLPWVRTGLLLVDTLNQRHGSRTVLPPTQLWDWLLAWVRAGLPARVERQPGIN
jgi:hypothetical protein